MNENNFKVRCIKNTGWKNCITKDKIYEFKDGVTIWDNGRTSYKYQNYENFKDINRWKGCFELVNEDEYPLTIQDIFKYPTNAKFEVQFSDGSKMCHKIRKSLSLLVDDETDELEYFSEQLLNAKFREFKIKQKEKKYIKPLEALKLIKKRQEVWCEYNNKNLRFANPNTKKIRIEHILNGKWYVLE